MAGPTLSHFQSQVRVIKERTAQLPATIPLATKDSRIATIFARLPIPDAPEEIWEVYTRRLDILYGESNRDGKTGRLPNIERGKHGLDMIVGFLELVVASTDWHKHFQWDAAMPKVLRLANELKDVIALATKSNGKRARHSTANAKGSDSEDDANYQPPKKKIDSDSDSDAPSAIFNSDGEEIVQETEVSKDLEAKREKKRREDQAEPGQEKMSKKKKKKQGKKKVRSKSPGTSQKPIDLLDSGEESDGQTAARKAAADAAKPRGARRGPPNQSMQHFSKPVATVDKTKQPRWEFKCKFCSAVRTFPRTVTTDNPSFDKEKTLPGGFNNLASHLSKCLPFKNRHSVQDSTDDEDEVDATDFNYKQSVQIMERFLKDGKLNPELVATREGFLRVFAAWILDQDLPWTTGEAPSLIFLFKYLKIKFLLPSDTAVRNQLAKMFAEMHQDVVEEFANVKSKIAFACDTWTTKQMVYTFACTIASFINDEWELIERVIDFRPLDSKEHEGLYAGMSFINSARNMSILHKFSALSTDNASVNDVLFKTVSRALLTLYNISPQGDSPDKDGRHIHCLAHVLNLVVQDMLSALDEAEKCVNEGDENDHYMQNKGAPIHYDPSQDSDLQDLEANREDDLNGTKDTNLSELEDLFKQGTQ